MFSAYEVKDTTTKQLGVLRSELAFELPQFHPSYFLIGLVEHGLDRGLRDY